MTNAAAGPLDGVTVLDLCSYLAGPYGRTLLADLGATVIKIESPQGDMLRQFPSSLAGESRFFLGANRGKRALAPVLVFPAKAGTHVRHGHRPSPVWQKL
jgi:crotonobetainyl-CoA:carnitine CoA-transferase CaiB-like acyl-CoA transferase